MKNATKSKVIQSGRTRFGDIVSEFWIPRRPSGKAIILCDGCPTVPSKRKIGEFLAKKGYWVFHPRYRGTWESGGEFLKHSPHEDVLIVADSLNRGFTEMWTKTTYVLDISDITVIGASFGGAAALIASIDPRIARAIALAPVVDITHKNKQESLDEFLRQIREGFGGAYRYSSANFKKLARGKFYNPTAVAAKIDPSKIFVVHALDDKIIPVEPLRKFAKVIKLNKNNLWIMKKGGHFSTNLIAKPGVWKHISRLFIPSTVR